MKQTGNKILLSDGKEYTILISFDANNKHYIIYTDHQKDEDGFIKTYAGIYSSKEGIEKLLPIKTDEQWQLVEKMLNKIEKDEVEK